MNKKNNRSAFGRQDPRCAGQDRKRRTDSQVLACPEGDTTEVWTLSHPAPRKRDLAGQRPILLFFIFHGQLSDTNVVSLQLSRSIKRC